MDTEPKFNQFFVTFLLNRIIRVEEDFVDQLFNSIERRLARLLCLLASNAAGPDGIGNGAMQPINPHISQGTLAQMIGATRSRVSMFMNKFRKMGFIAYDKGIMVNISLLNTILHDAKSVA
jgi:CRP-like cAMP-binding protein